MRRRETTAADDSTMLRRYPHRHLQQSLLPLRIQRVLFPPCWDRMSLENCSIESKIKQLATSHCSISVHSIGSEWGSKLQLHLLSTNPLDACPAELRRLVCYVPVRVSTCISISLNSCSGSELPLTNHRVVSSMETN